MQEKRMEFILKIAELNIKINSYYDEHFKSMTSDYVTDEKNVDINIRVNMVPNVIEEPKGKKYTDKPIFNWYDAGEGKYEYCYYEQAYDSLIIRIVFDTNTKDILVELSDVKKLFDNEPICFVYNAVQMAVKFIILYFNAFEIHASSIVYNGTGIAFSADSGTGKSTHTGLWIKNHPGTFLLNDDKPIVRFVDNEWKIYGSPWAGTTGINKNTAVPLKAMVFIERSEVNTIRDLTTPEAIKFFFNAIAHPFNDEITEKVIELTSLFITHSKMCLLGCNISDEAVEVVRRHLYD